MFGIFVGFLWKSLYSNIFNIWVMYWWNIKALAKELKAKKVSQLEKFKYFFAISIVAVVYLEFVYLVPLLEELTTLDVVGSLAYIFLVVLGTIFCYKANKEGDNKEFVDRFICLSWPIGIRIAAILIATLVLILIVGYSIAGDAFDTYIEKTTIIDVMVFDVGFTLAFYLWVRKYLLYVSGAVKEKKKA